MTANVILGRIAMRRLLAPGASLRVASARCIHNDTCYARRSLSSSVLRDSAIDDHDEFDRRMPVTSFTEDEEMVRDAARAWANQELKPIVRDMDNECKTRPEVIQALFDHGFMGMVSTSFAHKM